MSVEACKYGMGAEWYTKIKEDNLTTWVITAWCKAFKSLRTTSCMLGTLLSSPRHTSRVNIRKQKMPLISTKKEEYCL